MTEFHKTIVFTKVPLKGYFKYREVFQIYPANLDKLPYSRFQRHYPVILEYWTTADERINIPNVLEGLTEHFSNAATKVTKQNKILSVLSVFTNNIFFTYPSLEGFWGLPMTQDEINDEMNKWSSKWCINLFHFPELPQQLRIEALSSIDISPVKRAPLITYYTTDPNLDLETNTEIIFPESLETILDAYYKQPAEIMSIIDTAISYSVSSVELRPTKKTFSLLSAFSALETMVNLEFKDIEPARCKECGQLQYSVSKKFRDFLLKYIGNNEHNKRKFNNYYTLRSKIVHTGEQLKSEKLFADIPDDIRDKEFLTSLEIIQLGKLAIINWLIKNLKYHSI